MPGKVEISERMIAAGLAAFHEETYWTPHEELMSLIYSAMEHQRRREEAARTNVSA